MYPINFINDEFIKSLFNKFIYLIGYSPIFISFKANLIF